MKIVTSIDDIEFCKDKGKVLYWNDGRSELSFVYSKGFWVCYTVGGRVRCYNAVLPADGLYYDDQEEEK